MKKLNVGDRVFIKIKGIRTSSYSVDTIQKITPAGKYVLSNGDKYNPDGIKYGSKSEIRGFAPDYYLLEDTPENEQNYLLFTKNKYVGEKLKYLYENYINLDNLKDLDEIIENISIIQNIYKKYTK